MKCKKCKKNLWLLNESGDELVNIYNGNKLVIEGFNIVIFEDSNTGKRTEMFKADSNEHAYRILCTTMREINLGYRDLDSASDLTETWREQSSDYYYRKETMKDILVSFGEKYGILEKNEYYVVEDYKDKIKNLTNEDKDKLILELYKREYSWE